MIVVTGATGNTGKRIAEALLAAGEKVRVVGRSADKLKPFVSKGAEAFVGDVTNAGAMTRALTGATAAYLMIPPNYTVPDFLAYQRSVAEALATAVEKSGAKHVVTLSSLGADKPDKCGPVTGLHRFEQRMNKVADVNVLHLRPGYFFENFLHFIGVIKAMGMMASTLKGDLPIAMIATRDIGAYAAGRLRARDFAGQSTRELQGARDVTLSDAAGAIGKAIGKPGLSYSRVPAMMVKPALKQMGLTDNMADLLLEMDDALNSGYMKAQEPRSTANTTPTTLDRFVAEEFVPAFQGKAAAGH